MTLTGGVREPRAVIDSQDEVLLGPRHLRLLGRLLADVRHRTFASFINGTRKHVATSTSPIKEWAYTTLVPPPVADYASALKLQSVGDI